MNKYWAVIVPGILGGVIWYAYSAPGYVGTFDTPGINVLTLYDVARPVATAYTLVLHAALWLPITLLGAFYMLREGLGWADFGQAMRVAEAVNSEQSSASSQQSET